MEIFNIRFLMFIFRVDLLLEIAGLAPLARPAMPEKKSGVNVIDRKNYTLLRETWKWENDKLFKLSNDTGYNTEHFDFFIFKEYRFHIGIGWL